jgi:hypothetical protein
MVSWDQSALPMSVLPRAIVPHAATLRLKWAFVDGADIEGLVLAVSAAAPRARQK